MHIDIKNASWSQFCTLAKKCGFITIEGGKHTRVEDENGNLITTIPRSARINSHTANGIIQEFKVAGCERKDIKHIKNKK